MLRIPDAGWLDAEAMEALRAITGGHVSKKRNTVVLLAAAVSSDTAMAAVFADERACNERIWYQKWQHIPEVKNALEICTRAALDYRDAETAMIEAQAAQKRRRVIAQGSLDAVHGLRMTALNPDDRADYRTDASRMLLILSDAELAERLRAGDAAALAVDVVNMPAFEDIAQARESVLAWERERFGDDGGGDE